MLNPLDEDINCMSPVCQVTMELLEDKLGPSPSCCGAQLVPLMWVISAVKHPGGAKMI